jgi:putative membrane protein
VSRLTSSVPFVLNADWVWLLVGAGLLYQVGVLRVGVRRWPPARTAYFVGGIASLVVAFVSPLDNYDVVSLLAHMTQHLILIFVAAPLLAFGAPVDLLLKAAPPPVQAAARTVLRTKAVRIITNPPVAWSLFLVAVVATHVPIFYNDALTEDLTHNVEHAVYLAGGFLFWCQIAGTAPASQRMTPSGRMLYVLLAVVVLLAIGMPVLLDRDPIYSYYATLPRPWGGRAALLAQHRAALIFFTAALGMVAVFDHAHRRSIREAT